MVTVEFLGTRAIQDTVESVGIQDTAEFQVTREFLDIQAIQDTAE